MNKKYLRGFLKGTLILIGAMAIISIHAFSQLLYNGFNSMQSVVYEIALAGLNLFFVSYLVVKHGLPRGFCFLALFFGPFVIPFIFAEIESKKH